MRVVSSLLSLLAAFGGIALGPVAPVQEQPRTILTGRVIDAISGQGIADATVTADPLSPAVGVVASGQALLSQTDSTGTYSIPIRTAHGDAFEVTARAARYGLGLVGQMGPFDDRANGQVDVGGATGTLTVEIRLWPSCSITGRVTDDRGDPIPLADVVLLKRTYAGVEFRWARLTGGEARTDDRGIYRFETLRPGMYLVAARQRLVNGLETTGPFRFLPSADDVGSATSIVLEPGHSQVGADIRLNALSAAERITGRLVGPPPLGGADVLVVREPSGGSRTDLDIHQTIADAEGRFTVAGLAAGTYRIKTVILPSPSSANPPRMPPLPGLPPRPVPRMPWMPLDVFRFDETPPSTGPTWYADEPVVVTAGAETAAVVTLKSAATIAGRLVTAGQEHVAGRFQGIRIALRPADGFDLGAIPAPRVTSTDEFETAGLPPGSYVVVPIPMVTGFLERPGEPPTHLTALRTWSVVSAQLEGRDVLGDAVILSDRHLQGLTFGLAPTPSMLSGTVRGSDGQPPRRARVIVFPEEEDRRTGYFAGPSSRRVTQGIVMPGGTFRTWLPSGAYLAAAIDSDIPEFWMTPEYLRTLEAGASRVQVPVAGTAVVHLSVRDTAQK